MKKVVLLLIVILVLTGCSFNASNITDLTKTDDVMSVDTSDTDISKYDDDYLSFFEDDYIHELRITIDTEDFQDMLDHAIEEEFHHADISLDGVSLENIAMRTKGNSTLRDVANSDSERYSFKFKTNEYEDQKLLGLDEFVINNMFSDASYMREYFSYHMFEQLEIQASQASFVNVYINDDLYGFYLLVETIDDSFLKTNFGNNDGNLYRMDQGSTLALLDGDYQEAASQKNGEDESKDDLYELINKLNAMPEGEKGDIESILDVESALDYIAANTLLESYDSYSGQHAQNYYLYNNEGIFTLIPWDYNMSFGTFGSDHLNISVDQPVSGARMEDRPLISNLLAVDSYYDRYLEILEEMMAYFDTFENDVEILKQLIEDEVVNDPSRFSTLDDFESSTIYQVDGPVEVNLMRTKDQGMTQPQKTNNEDRLTRPQNINTRPGDDNGQNNMVNGNGISIINIIKARIDAINNQID